MTVENHESYILDPVAAYRGIAPFYAKLSQQRAAYLQQIDRLVIARIPHGSQSLLDIGAGDGRRALHISRERAIPAVVLLEPSEEMHKPAWGKAEILAMRAEDISTPNSPLADRRFDVITCLWNVLGHIRPEARRREVLQSIARLLTPAGLFFLDVNHRYNCAAYGMVKTVARFIKDRVHPGESNGDVRVSWNFGAAQRSTYGHVFTDREVRALVRSAGLTIRKRVAVNYGSGAVETSTWRGNLFYVLAATSASANSSAEQTSSTSASVI